MAIAATALQEKILKVLSADPTLTDPSRVSVSVEKKGLFGKEKVYLSGTVKSETERKKIHTLAQNSAAGREIVDTLHVS